MTKQDAVIKLADLLEARAEIGNVQQLADAVGISRQRLYQLANDELATRSKPADPPNRWDDGEVEETA